MKTVKIVCKENTRLGYKIINESDLVDEDVLFEGEEEVILKQGDIVFESKEVNGEVKEVIEKPKKKLLKKKKQ